MGYLKLKKSGYYILVIIVAIYFTNNRIYSLAYFISLEDFAALNYDKPYLNRILIPFIVNCVTSQIPLNPRHLFEVTEFVSISLMIIFFRKYLSLFIKSDFLISIFSFSIVAMFPFLYNYQFHPYFVPYDTYSILFFIVASVFLYQKKWLLFYITFFIATFNKETTCFLSILFLIIYFDKIKTQFLVSHFAAQLGIWLLVKYIVFYFLRDRSGDQFILLFKENIELFTKSGSPLVLISRISILLGNFCFIWLVSVIGYKQLKNETLKRSLLLLFPFCIGMFLVGSVIENRIYGEMAPIVLTSFWCILIEYIKMDKHCYVINDTRD